jgi:DNA-directed RNA polymerase specialized sigma subunit
MDKKLEEKFARFADMGITEIEVKAAAETLKRETGRKPTVKQIADYLDAFINWRHFYRKWKNGEVLIRYEYTDKGKKVKGVEAKVNNIFHSKGGE